MANDKMTYNEFFGELQTSALGRQMMGIEIEENLKRKYITSGAKGQGLTLDQFIALRESQMKALFNAYVEMRRGSYRRLMGPRDTNDVSEEAIRRVTGPNGLRNSGLIAADHDDRSMISELVSRSSGYDGNPYHYADTFKVPAIINNSLAVKSITEKELGVTLSHREFCSSTDAMLREIHMADYTYSTDFYKPWAEYQRPGKFAKMVKSIGDLVNGVKEQDKPLGEQQIPDAEK